MPNVHQSTAEVCPAVWMTSGAMYSKRVKKNQNMDISRDELHIPSVPTKEFVRKSAVHERVSISGIWKTRRHEQMGLSM